VYFGVGEVISVVYAKDQILTKMAVPKIMSTEKERIATAKISGIL
jgi:hypothetical protein